MPVKFSGLPAGAPALVTDKFAKSNAGGAPSASVTGQDLVAFFNAQLGGGPFLPLAGGVMTGELYFPNGTSILTDGTITVGDALSVGGGITVFAGSVAVAAIGEGFILKSPDGTNWRITIDSTGALNQNSI